MPAVTRTPVVVRSPPSVWAGGTKDSRPYSPVRSVTRDGPPLLPGRCRVPGSDVEGGPLVRVWRWALSEVPR